jgi:hypothetical protein
MKEVLYCFSLITLSFFGMWGRSDAQKEPQKKALEGDDLIEVGGERISTLDFLEMAFNQNREEAILILKTLMMEKLLLLETEAHQIFVTEEEQDEMVAKEKALLEQRIKVEFKEDYKLETYLKSQDLTLKQFILMTRDKVTKQLLLGKLIRYLQMKEDRIEMLYMEFSTKEQGEKVYELLKQGESFSKLAQKYSQHQSRQNGGKLPVLTRSYFGNLAPTLFALDPEHQPLSEVLENQKKFHLFKVLKKYRKKEGSFESLNTLIFKDLQEQGLSPSEIDDWVVQALERHQPEAKNKIVRQSHFIELIKATSPRR